MASDLFRENSQGGRFLLLHERDNVLICAEYARRGTSVVVDGQQYILTSDIEIGHKIARTRLVPGQKVFRYGVKIGTVSAEVAPAEHVHGHNLQSDYIAAHHQRAMPDEGSRS